MAGRSWRRHSDEFKSRVIESTRQGHRSVAAVALANPLNATMLLRWVPEAELADAAPAVSRPRQHAAQVQALQAVAGRA